MTKQAAILPLILFLVTAVYVDCFAIFVAPLRAQKRVSQIQSNNEINTVQLSAWKTSLSTDPDADVALNELLSTLGAENETPDVAFLFVGMEHAGSFTEIAKRASERMPETKMMALVGGGIVGGGSEVDQSNLPAMSIMSGVLPKGSNVNLFSFNELTNPPPNDPADSFWTDLRLTKEGRPPSFLLFVDPWSPIETILSGLHGSVVAGGISVPANAQPTVAMNGQALPQGSAVAIQFTGTFGVQAIASQGCRPVGPIFTVTSNIGNALEELDGIPALEQLQSVASDASEEDRKLMSTAGYLVGIASEGDELTDFLIRQIIGFQPDKGAVVIGARVKTGDRVRFHVRDAKAAKEDMLLQMDRTKTERLFAGRANCGTPVAALQISCVARGQGMFGIPNVDLNYIASLFEDDQFNPPVAGFFANGEIGPVGIAGFNEQHTIDGTYMHGFTTVVGLLCDFSESSSATNVESLLTTATNDDQGDAWE